ncbi:MAG: hypothetical protein Q9217_002561 [Psora testacea]
MTSRYPYIVPNTGEDLWEPVNLSTDFKIKKRKLGSSANVAIEAHLKKRETSSILPVNEAGSKTSIASVAVASEKEVPHQRLFSDLGVVESLRDAFHRPWHKNLTLVVATPGPLLDHIENTKRFSLRNLKYLVMDEAHRLLDLNFGAIIDKNLKGPPRKRRTYLFSATMTSRVESLQRVSLVTHPVSHLLQSYLFIPYKVKDLYLVHLIIDDGGRSSLIFTRTVNDLGFGAIPLHGQLSQSARLGALGKFRARSRDVLVATEVAARGLDISSVDIVVNFKLPPDSKTYIHRVGRTAQAGKSGHAISMVTQCDVEIWQSIEAALGKKAGEYQTESGELLVLKERVEEAQKMAVREMKDLHGKRGSKGAILKGEGAWEGFGDKGQR